MSGKFELLGLDILLVDRCGDHYVNVARFEIPDSRLQRQKCRFSCFCGGFPQFHPDLLIHTIDDVDSFGVGLTGIGNLIEAKQFDIKGFSVIGGNFWGSVDNWRARL